MASLKMMDVAVPLIHDVITFLMILNRMIPYKKAKD